MDNVKFHGRSGRAQPSPVSGDGLDVDGRMGRAGEVYTLPYGTWRRQASSAGIYFVAHNATNDAATTLAGHPAPVLADADATLVKPFIFIRHAGSVTSQVEIELDFLEIEVVTAGANGTQACWATQIDSGATRASGGTALTVVNPNMKSSTTTVCTVLGGAITAAAETSACRALGHGTHRPSIEVAGDKYTHIFGGDQAVSNSTAAATVRTFVVNQPPVILGPTDSFLFALHGQAAQDAAGVYKVRMGWVERGA